jgi:hypothetical protein
MQMRERQQEDVAKSTRRARDRCMFTAAKDAVASQAARTFVNDRIARYGQVRELKIDSRAKTVAVVCELIGESEPVNVRVDSYRLVSENGQHFVEVVTCSCSRPWLNNLLADHACGRRWVLPAWAAKVL